MDAEAIRRFVGEGRYTFSKHAEREREADMIQTQELEEATLSAASCAILRSCS